MVPVWTVVSGKGGVGKSTLCASLAAGLARRGLRVVLLDMDTGLRNLDMLLHIENRVIFDLVDVVDGEADLAQALVADRQRPGLFLLSSSQIHDAAAISREDFEAVLRTLRESFDHILIDCPSGIGHSFRLCTQAATDAIVVTTPDEIAMRDADRVLGLLRQREGIAAHLVVNRVRPDWVAARAAYSPQVIAQTLDARLAGYLREDEEVLRCLIERRLLIESDTVLWQEVDAILRRLLGERIPIPDIVPAEPRRGFWARLFGRLPSRQEEDFD